MPTAEKSETEVEPSGAAPAQQKAARTRRLRLPAWLLWLLVVGVATSLVVAVTLNLYRDPAPESTPASNGAAAVKLAPLLNPLSLGKAYPGCLDPRSHLDMMVLCPGDLADGWGYDAGLSQPQGVALPSCANDVAGTPVSWVQLNNGLTHVQEQVSVHSSPASAQAVVHRLSATPGTALCTNLSEPASSSVKLLPVATPDAAAAAVAWSVPATGRTLDVVFVAVGNAVIRLDLTEIGDIAGSPPPGVEKLVVDAAVARYLAG